MDLQLGAILLWGFFATGVLTLIMSGSQQIGWSRMSLPFMLGSMFSNRRRWAMMLGFGAHLVFGCLFALLYGLVFESLDRVTWWLGGLLGLYHGAFVLIVLIPMMPSVHPRMAGKHHGPSPTRQLEPPGFLALNYGRRTPIITLVGHVIYGVILGLFYPLAS
jgi:uncharacterized membrane protein YagU involved in acid resistance